MDVDHDESQEPPPRESPPPETEWANCLGYGPTQVAVGNSGFGKGKDDSDKGKGKDYWNKGSPAGTGNGEQRPVGACPFCLDF